MAKPMNFLAGVAVIAAMGVGTVYVSRPTVEPHSKRRAVGGAPAYVIEGMKALTVAGEAELFVAPAYAFIAVPVPRDVIEADLCVSLVYGGGYYRCRRAKRFANPRKAGYVIVPVLQRCTSYELFDPSGSIRRVDVCDEEFEVYIEEERDQPLVAKTRVSKMDRVTEE